MRLGNQIPRFGRPIPQLSMIASEITSFVYDMHYKKLDSFQQQRLALQSWENLFKPYTML